MAYIDETKDITDTVIDAFANDDRVDTWLDEVDSAINILAERNDVDQDDIESTLHPMVKRYGVAYYGMIVCRDNIGVNNVETSADEKYRIKYDMYSKEVTELKQSITAEMFTDSDGELTAEEHVRGGIIWLA